jgi:hypothetical protein
MASKTKRETVRAKTTKKRMSAMAASPLAAGATTAGADASADSRVTVRHYCQGIGDCHLLKFPKHGGGDFFMLIDCGVHSSVPDGAKTISKIVDDLASVAPHIDIVVATHEHWDHVSGFMTSAETFKKKITFGEAWMAWTENPADPQGRQLDKFKTDAVAALQAGGKALRDAGAIAPHLAAVRDGVDHVLGFFGLKGERVRHARDAILELTGGKVRYLEAKDSPLSLATLDNAQRVDNVRVYVLGPPRDAKLLGLTERASEMYGLAGGHPSPLVDALSNALRVGKSDQADDYAMPFDPNYGTPFADLFGQRAEAKRKGSANGGQHTKAAKAAAGKIAAFVRDHYGKAKPGRRPRDQAWRRIDDDWLSTSADLAIQLDSRTNNSSLVLAIEFVDTKRVLLFVGDAQVGSWLSWQDLKWTVGNEQVTGPDLLKRTVYYKVGHHGSDNATLKAKGLELMTSSDFSAFIPTNEKDALRVKWGAMPFKGIMDDLKKHGHDSAKNGDRVIRADDPWISTATVPADFPISGSIRKLRHQQGLWVELDLA